jgi:hypothetical protein
VYKYAAYDALQRLQRQDARLRGASPARPEPASGARG